ncbi:membrane protein [Skermanella stibiiresistens SB22]|uniref:Membrane protein n=1 Tax=Skermanella stibiiresistens SB22 TaxID=1385369 RepID=W9GZW0_9PROT|nr:membrane protein [Skermanella stibiiresistens]EWY37028.1 membrane protein [Skermanella stibiiresistens SB22]
MFRTHYDLPLQRDVTGKFLPWIIALMVYLAMLAMAGSMVLSDMARRWDRGLAGTLTVQVAPLPNQTPPLGDRVNTALAVLRATPGIARAEALPRQDLQTLLEPWLGTGALNADLPIPAMIDVTLAGGRIDMRGLAQRLQAAVPGAELDDHAAWLKDLLAIARAVEAVALGVVALVGGAAVATVIFVSRAGLAIHGPVVELLHVMGAPDRYVARQFQSHVLGLAIRGGIIGTVLAAATLLGLRHAGGEYAAGLLPDMALGQFQLVALALVPVCAAGLAAVTARVTVSRALARLP